METLYCRCASGYLRAWTDRGGYKNISAASSTASRNTLTGSEKKAILGGKPLYKRSELQDLLCTISRKNESEVSSILDPCLQ